MTSTFIDAGGQTVAASVVALPPDRAFRDAWALDGNTIVLDPGIKRQVLVERVKAEAERRINEGTSINGVLFKCDDQSTNRLHGMWQEAVLIEAGGGSYSATFRTESGSTVTVTSAAQAEAVFKAAVAFVRLILGKSAALQAMQTIPENYDDDSYWSA